MGKMALKPSETERIAGEKSVQKNISLCPNLKFFISPKMAQSVSAIKIKPVMV